MSRFAELETLVAIADGGSLAAAGRRLRRSPPAISRILANLERRAGVRLVDRSTRVCRLTPAGSILAEHARNLLGGYEDAIRAPAGEEVTPGGVIRMTAPTIFGRDHIAPLILSFLERHREISIDLQLIDRVVDLADEDFDLGVRIGTLGSGDAVARRVGQVRQMVVASPQYLSEFGTPQRPGDLAQHSVVQHTRDGLNAPWTFNGLDGRIVAVAVNARIGINQPEAAIRAAVDGHGLVRVLSHQVQAALADGCLVRVLDPFEPLPLPISLVWPSSRHLWRRMRLLIDHLASSLHTLEPLPEMKSSPPDAR